MKSIIQTQKRCYLTGREDNLHEHHVFYGTGKRKLSERYGLKIWLSGEFHNLSDYGVHGKHGRELDLKIKRDVQIEAMAYYGWSIEDFIKIFGRNYV